MTVFHIITTPACFLEYIAPHIPALEGAPLLETETSSKLYFNLTEGLLAVILY